MKKQTKLPIAAFRDQIVAAVKGNPVTIITAETGAGKSTQVPQYLLDEGYDLVVTQPRRLAARTVAQRVSEEIGGNLGETVGYRTAVDRQDSLATRCLFCTDGLALVRELMGQNKGILVLDEVHEWNENMEVLAAWAKRQSEEGADFKVVLMSATLEAEKLSAFYNGAPVITVPGRMFPVEVKSPSSRLVDDVADLVQAGRNVLVFQPGKQEIAEICSALEQMQVNAEILPLHGQLTPEEQAKCFKHYGRPKVVVSTNVAQTSVTIDDIDAVVDSGLERRIELVDGVEGLYLKPVSLADSTQRKGRAGRTKEGLYVDHCDSANRPDFPVAEIMRKRLDQTVLRLAIAGFDMEELKFFHQPEVLDIHDARETLIGLGCMNADGTVTRIGKLVNRLPVSVQYGRMLVEGDRLGVINDILTVAAIMEMSGITVPPPSRNRPDRPDWRLMVPDEHESDVMGQLQVWELAKTMSKDEMREGGISLRNYFRAKEIRRHLESAVKRFFQFGSTGRREDILKAVCAGMVDHLFKGQYGSYRNGEGVNRELGSASCVRGAEWLVGKPFDLQIKTRRRGMLTLKLIELASKVDPMWLTEIASQLVEVETGGNPRYDCEKECVVSTTNTIFNGSLVKEETVEDRNHPEAPAILNEQAWNGWEKPEVSIPNFSADSSVEIPEIADVVYATSKIDGSSLTAYGVVYNSWGGWSYKWTRDESEAQHLRKEAATKLAELRARWALRDSFLSEIDQINGERKKVSLPKLEAKDNGFSCWSRTLDYATENLDFARDEVACKKVFDNLNAQREKLGLSALSLDSDGEFSLDGYKKLTEENLNLIRQNIVDEKERLERVKRKQAERIEAQVEFNKLNERRRELEMRVLTICSNGEFYLDGYHELTPENLQLIRDNITEKEQEIKTQHLLRKREERERKKEETRAEDERKRNLDEKKAQDMASGPFAVLAQLKVEPQ